MMQAKSLFNTPIKYNLPQHDHRHNVFVKGRNFQQWKGFVKVPEARPFPRFNVSTRTFTEIKQSFSTLKPLRMMGYSNAIVIPNMFQQQIRTFASKKRTRNSENFQFDMKYLEGKQTQFHEWKNWVMARPGILFVGGIGFLYLFGGMIFTVVKWALYGALGFGLVAWAFRRFKRVWFKDFYTDAIVLLRKIKPQIEKEIGGEIKLPELKDVKFFMDNISTNIGDRSTVRFRIHVQGDNGMGNVECMAYSTAENRADKIKVQSIYLEYLTGLPSPDGRVELKTKRVDYYTNKSAVTIIDGQTMEAHQEQVEIINDKEIQDADFKEIKK